MAAPLIEHPEADLAVARLREVACLLTTAASLSKATQRSYPSLPLAEIIRHIVRTIIDVVNVSATVDLTLPPSAPPNEKAK